MFAKGCGGCRGITTKEHGGNLGDNKEVVHLYCGDGYMSVYLYQNPLNDTLKIGKFYFL